MSIIFSIIGLTILGLFVRGFFEDKSLQEGTETKQGCFFQLIVCLIVGVVVFSIIPKSCKNRDYDPTDYQKLK